MKLYTILFCLSALTHVASWNLQSDYKGQFFFDKFNFFSRDDPTHGFVQYQNMTSAKSNGYAYVSDHNRFIMKADNKSIAPLGRPSVRIESKKLYNSGLFIFDINHMPAGCGTWPAYWLIGQQWTNYNEIDIVEGVNNQTNNGMALHVSTNCTMLNTKQVMTGTAANHSICGLDPGCGIKVSASNSYGTGFNNNGGGIYAMRWTNSSGIQIWFFARDSIIPKDIIQQKNPTPEKWGTPAADYPFFGNNCSPKTFGNMKIVINLAFCGEWASSTSSYKGCPSDCKTYVMNTPHAFDQAYWDINYLRVYQ